MYIEPGTTRSPSAVILAIFGLAWITPAHAAEPMSNTDLMDIIREQRAMIEAQREDLQALRNRVDRLEDGFSESGYPSAGVEPQVAYDPQDTEPIDLEASKSGREDGARHVEPFDLAVEADRMHPNMGMHIAIPELETKLTVSGFAKADFIHDFRGIRSKAQFIPAEIIIPSSSNEQTTFSANPSRFAIATATPTRFGRLTTLFSMDLFGDKNSDKPVPRLRQAWGQLDNLLFGVGLRAGQSWSTWDDVPALPETLDFWGPNGSDQTRHPLLRWILPIGENWNIWAALEDPENVVAVSDQTTSVGRSETRWPDGVLSAIYVGDWGQVKPTVLLRDVGAQLRSLQTDEAEGSIDRAFGWGVSVSGKLNAPWLAAKDNVRFQLQYGEGVGKYINSEIPDAVINGSKMDLIPVFAGYLALQHWWTEELRSNATFGWVDIYNRGMEAPDALNRTFYTAGNLIWSPIPQVDLGVEFLWGQRREKSGREAEDPRLQFSAHYRF